VLPFVTAHALRSSSLVRDTVLLKDGTYNTAKVFLRGL